MPLLTELENLFSVGFYKDDAPDGAGSGHSYSTAIQIHLHGCLSQLGNGKGEANSISTLASFIALQASHSSGA
jgi:hypothetical protein